MPNATPEQLRAEIRRVRDEAATRRDRARRADELEPRLHTALVAATGRLADPSDLPFDAAHLDDADALTAALDALVEAKPHLASRRPTGDVGQGPRETGDAGPSLHGLLRSGT